jgi:hypothetical protein
MAVPRVRSMRTRRSAVMWGSRARSGVGLQYQRRISKGEGSVRRGGIWAGAGQFHLVMLTQKSFVRLGRPAYHGCMTFWSAQERDGYMNPSSQLKAALSIRTAAV